MANTAKGADREAKVNVANVPDIKEVDVVWQFAPQIARDAWHDNEYFGVDALKTSASGWWSAEIKGNQPATVKVKFAQNWSIESSNCSVHAAEKNPHCLHVAELLFEMTRQELVNSVPSPSRVRAQKRETAQHEDLPFEAVAIPLADKIARRSLSAGGIGPLLERREWLDIVRILELMTSMGNVRMALRRRNELGISLMQETDAEGNESEGAKDFEKSEDHEAEDTTKNLNINSLPTIWFTLLEAGYESLGDSEGLKNLYRFYITSGRVESPQKEGDIDYLLRFKTLTGEKFVEEARFVVNLAYTEKELEFERTSAVEDLIRMAKLSDDALFYCSCLHGNEQSRATSDMAETIALSHLEEAGKMLLAPLYDADSWLYEKKMFFDRGKWKKPVFKIRSQVHKVGRILGPQKALEMTRYVQRMFPQRSDVVGMMKLEGDRIEREMKRNGAIFA